MKIILAIIIFSAIVLFHELGHFLLAKKNGIVVTEFSLGMGPRLVSTVKGGTRYSLKLLPFGGSCLMVGLSQIMNDSNNITSPERDPLSERSKMHAPKQDKIYYIFQSTVHNHYSMINVKAFSTTWLYPGLVNRTETV